MKAFERRLPAYWRVRKTRGLPKELDAYSGRITPATVRRVPFFHWLPAEKRTTNRSQREQGQPVFYKNQLFRFNANNYLTEPEQLWLIESVVGSETLRNVLHSDKVVDNRFIESLFKAANFSFYLSSDDAYLLGYDDELTQSDFGPLIQIDALAALQRFGIVALEQAKEKTVVRL